MLPVIKTNYAFLQKFYVRVGSAAESVSGYVITACVKDSTKTIKLITDTVQLEDTGWVAGVVTLQFPTVSDTLAAQDAFIEIQVTIGGTKYSVPDIACKIEKGLIV